MKKTLVIFLGLFISSALFAFEQKNESCIAIANRSETSDIATIVYFKCLDSRLNSKALEQCAYNAANMINSGNALMMDLDQIDSNAFLNCIAR